jgi:HEAT repeat protein/TolA-binding protein
MKRITLATVALVTGSMVAVAQEPPTPPTPPVRPAPAPQPAPVAPDAPTPRPAPAPAARVRNFDFDFDSDRARAIARDADQMARDAARIDQEQIRDLAREASRIDQEQVREIARQASEMARETVRIDQEQARVMARDMARNFDFAPRAGITIDRPYIEPLPPIPPMPAIAPMAPMAYGVNVGRDFTNRQVPAPWVQGDPADSIWRVARDALNGGDYGRAARTFNELVAKYPKSQYVDGGTYYEALARYKIGTTDELHQAAKILEPMVAKLPARAGGSDNSSQQRAGVSYGQGCNGFGCTPVAFYKSGFSDSEVAALYNRVNGALAQRGDKGAQAIIEKAAAQAGTASCDREDLDVRTEAMSALSQMDAATAMPVLKRVLDRKDDCSAQLRRSAVFMLGRRQDTESANLLIAVAKSDPNVDVRVAAINYLSKLPGDAGLAALDDLLKSDQDERIQRAAIRALNSSDNVRARSGMRALIDRKDAPMNLRLEAINSLSSDRTTNDDAAYLRGLYAKAENDQMKDAILNAVSRIGGTDNDQFVLNIAKNPNESSRIRSSALSRLSRSPTVTTADFGKIYDAADSYDVRSRIVQILGSRKDTESADKLIDIAKTGTVVQIRKEAINALLRRQDPRATQLFMDLLDGKKP